MTKEELEKEATEYALEWGTTTDGTYACCRDGYLAGAEPREKQIAELGERCLQLQKDKGNLTDRVRELEAQIEKLQKEKKEIIHQEVVDMYSRFPC